MGLADLVRLATGGEHIEARKADDIDVYPEPPEGTLSSEIWTTRDGTRVRFVDLTDRHLCNILLFLARLPDAHLEALRRSELSAGWSCLSMLNGDMAIMCAEQELDRLSWAEGRAELIPLVTPWYRLTAIAEERGLPVPDLGGEL